MVIGTPQPLEQALSKSGIYSISIPTLIKNQTSYLATVPTDQPEVQDAIQKAFPPELLEQYANQIIGNTYDWVQGRTTEPNFKVDVSQAKVNFADNIAGYVKTRSQALPVCTSLPKTTEINPYTLTCRPVQASPEAIATQARQEIMSSDFLGDGVITADTIKEVNGKPLSEQLQAVPTAYKWTIWSMWATGIAVLVVSAIIILIQRQQWRAALGRMGIVFFTVGLLSALLAWGSSFVLGTVTDKLLASASTQELIQTKLITVAHLLTDDLRHWWLGFGIAAVVIGIVMWLVGKFVKPRSQTIAQHAPLVAENAAHHSPESTSLKPVDTEPEISGTSKDGTESDTLKIQPPTVR